MRKIKFIYRGTENPTDPSNFQDFPVDSKETIHSTVTYDDHKNRSYTLKVITPTQERNEAFFDSLFSPIYVKEKTFRVSKSGKTTKRKEPKLFGLRTDVPIEIEGIIIRRRGKEIVVLDKDEMWIYTLRKKD